MTMLPPPATTTTTPPPPTTTTGFLDRAKHVRYWQRCLASHLPSQYTASDSTRLTLAFFIVSALDLLAVPLTASQRSSIRAWVLSLQHPDGGFCGSPAHALHRGQDASRGSANLAATFFALLILGAVAGTAEGEARSTFAALDRRKTLAWLKRLQRDDGSFGQVLWDGEPVGGHDVRHAYLAAGIRFILRRPSPDRHSGLGCVHSAEDIDVERMASHVRRCQNYDGGISEHWKQESHAGYAYCAIAALSLLHRSPSTKQSPAPASTAPRQMVAPEASFLKLRSLLDFLVHRQVADIADEEDSEEGGDETVDGGGGSGAGSADGLLARLSLDGGEDGVLGFNGRLNKAPDTCYSWWVVASLKMLGAMPMVRIPPSRDFILAVTQHPIGGFSKTAGDPPDLFHSYLGLAALAMMGEPGLKDFDIDLCCSQETARKLELAREGFAASDCRTTVDQLAGDGFWEAIGAKSRHQVEDT